MASNRFDFLEISGQPDGGSADKPAHEQPAAGEPFGPAHLKVDEPVPALETQHNSNIELDEGAIPRYPFESFVEPQRPQPQMGQGGRGAGLTTYHAPEQQRLPGEMDIRAVEVFGSRGSAVGEFNFPTGLAIDRDGILFVADVYNHRVQRITPDGGVALVGSRGTSKTQFLAPAGIACDADRSFYVVEQGNNRVQKFTKDGTLQMVFGRKGDRAGEFRAPMGICISAATHEILVADTGNGRVQRFTMAGEYLGALGAAGSLQPPLTNPQTVACDHHGNIYVADTLANRIARYDPLGRFTGHFGGLLTRGLNAPSPNVRFTEPHALACSVRGDLFVADGNHGAGRLVVMASDTGAVKATLADPGGRLGELARPGGIAVATQMRSGFPDGLPRADLYLADTMNHRIIRFTVS